MEHRRGCTLPAHLSLRLLQKPPAGERRRYNAKPTQIQGVFQIILLCEKQNFASRRSSPSPESTHSLDAEMERGPPMSLSLRVRKLIPALFIYWCKSSLCWSEAGGWRFVSAAGHYAAPPAPGNRLLWWTQALGRSRGKCRTGS